MQQAFLTALVLAAMGLAFLAADPRTPTSRALSMSLVAGGLSVVTNTFLRFLGADGPMLYLAPLTDALALWLAFEWLVRMRRTIPNRALQTRFGDNLVRAAQLLVLVYLILSLLYPQARAAHFIGGLNLQNMREAHWFWLFTAPLDLAMLLAACSLLLLFKRRPDAAESKRLIAILFALPAMAAGWILPEEWAPTVTVLGAMILLVGAIQYHVDQGRRSEFLGRFLSPDVAGMVRSRGLESVGRETRDISVLHCDIRGFTRRCGSLSSAEILELLRAFYADVGRACQQHEATIKDYAGDGVMMLIGAPLPTADPEGRALRLARDLHRECAATLQQWSTADAPIGLAVGIATGPVTLGIIGALRLEYVAVGSTVNLAARLCESAGPGETLLDRAPVEGCADQRALPLKGFGEAVPAYLAI